MNFIFEWSTRYLTSERSERVKYRVDHEKIKFISISGHVIFCLLYKHQFCRGKGAAFKGAIYYVTINTVISSHVKITCYLHVWRYEVFAGKFTWYFTGVYIINKFSSSYTWRRHKLWWLFTQLLNIKSWWRHLNSLFTLVCCVVVRVRNISRTCAQLTVAGWLVNVHCQYTR